uniref:Putative secreted protein n=1 Tax=Anopheles marajoara TaxID=58244 RepID=A0A2M4CBE3_9DIPT
MRGVWSIFFFILSFEAPRTAEVAVKVPPANLPGVFFWGAVPLMGKFNLIASPDPLAEAEKRSESAPERSTSERQRQSTARTAVPPCA